MFEVVLLRPLYSMLMRSKLETAVAKLGFLGPGFSL